MHAFRILVAAALFGAPAMVSAAAEPLWPQGAPGALGTAETDVPTLTAYPAAAGRAVRAAVVVCPGGGYANLALDHEGVQIARWLNQRGISAFVLRYRHGPRYRHPTPLGDVQRAIRTVRARAPTLAIDPARIGVWGFSAGGHLASTAATFPSDGDAQAADPIDRVSARPDFVILAYPVIMMTGDRIHQGSRKHLLGDNPAAIVAEALSTDRRVTANTPPTFLFHTADDAAVPVENALAFFGALRRANVPAELHVYESGRHGVGLAAADPILRSWPDRLDDWLRRRGVLPARSEQVKK